MGKRTIITSLDLFHNCSKHIVGEKGGWPAASQPHTYNYFILQQIEVAPIVTEYLIAFSFPFVGTSLYLHISCSMLVYFFLQTLAVKLVFNKK
jgi:hypothetical protein